MQERTHVFLGNIMLIARKCWISSPFPFVLDVLDDPESMAMATEHFNPFHDLTAFKTTHRDRDWELYATFAGSRMEIEPSQKRFQSTTRCTLDKQYES